MGGFGPPEPVQEVDQQGDRGKEFQGDQQACRPASLDVEQIGKGPGEDSGGQSHRNRHRNRHASAQDMDHRQKGRRQHEDQMMFPRQRGDQDDGQQYCGEFLVQVAAHRTAVQATADPGQDADDQSGKKHGDPPGRGRTEDQGIVGM